MIGGDSSRGDQVLHILDAVIDRLLLAGIRGVAGDPLGGRDEPFEVGGGWATPRPCWPVRWGGGAAMGISEGNSAGS